MKGVGSPRNRRGRPARKTAPLPRHERRNRNGPCGSYGAAREPPLSLSPGAVEVEKEDRSLDAPKLPEAFVDVKLLAAERDRRQLPHAEEPRMQLGFGSFGDAG